MATREAVIVSTARTPIGKAYRGAFNATPSPTLASFAIKAAVERAKIDPAEVDGNRYTVSRERQDRYALRSQQLTAKAQAEGRFDAEIVPVTAKMMVKNKETGETSIQEVTLTKDEGNRPSTTYEDLAKLQPV